MPTEVCFGFLAANVAVVRRAWNLEMPRVDQGNTRTAQCGYKRTLQEDS